MQADYTPKDYLDNLEEVDGFVPLICSVCKDTFRGWKLKKVCRICAVPKFPTDIEHIVSVGIMFDSKLYSCPAPDRHHHVLRLIYAEHGSNRNCNISVQGFVNNKGEFLDRKDALVVALRANQVIDPNSVRANQLFSEDLW